MLFPDPSSSSSHPPLSPPVSLLGVSLAGVYGYGLTFAGYPFSRTTYHRSFLIEAHRLTESGIVVDQRPCLSDPSFRPILCLSPILSLKLPPSGYRRFNILHADPETSPIIPAFPMLFSWPHIPPRGVLLDEFGAHAYAMFWYLRGARIAYRSGPNLLWHRSGPSLEERRAAPPSIPWTPSESYLEPIPLTPSSEPSQRHSW